MQGVQAIGHAMHGALVEVAVRKRLLHYLLQAAQELLASLGLPLDPILVYHIS